MVIFKNLFFFNYIPVQPPATRGVNSLSLRSGISSSPCFRHVVSVCFRAGLKGWSTRVQAIGLPHVSDPCFPPNTRASPLSTTSQGGPYSRVGFKPCLAVSFLPLTLALNRLLQVHQWCQYPLLLSLIPLQGKNSPYSLLILTELFNKN